jgi:plasmid replication initiation protein
MDFQNIPLEKKIKQHNTITSGRYDFSACQLDVLFMLLANLNENDAPYKRYNIRVKDIELITGRKWNYQQLVDSNEDMMSRVFKIEEIDGLKQIVLFSEIKYLGGTGSFDIVINEPARSYFFDLKNNFTLLELKSVLGCSSKHAKRLYTLACQWRTAGGIAFDISELKEMLGLKDPKGNEPEQYKQIGQFKEKVLDVAKKQINEHTDITFDYELLKTRGRSFDKIKLFCGFAKPKFQLEIDFNSDIEKQKENAVIIQKMVQVESYGISKKVATILATNNVKWKGFLDAIEIAKKDMISGKTIEDKGAYIIGIIKNKGIEI